MRDALILAGFMALVMFGGAGILVFLDERDKRKKREQAQRDASTH